MRWATFRWFLSRCNRNRGSEHPLGTVAAMEIVLTVAVVILTAVVVFQARRKPASTPAVTTPPVSPDDLTTVTKQSNDLLGAKAQVIDATLKGVTQDVTKRLSEINTELQNLRESSSKQYGSVEEAVSALAKRTDNLKDILSNSQKRGQWGERLAEDILRSAGFVEGKNYSKQQQIEGGGKPDYRFEMPPDRVLFMDVKFPLDQYSLYIAAEDEAVRANAKVQFLNTTYPVRLPRCHSPGH
ncbi:MAG: DNA recombination protein RmuC [Actinobacteria bacterium]|nr:DNA recombination protein RmuC [Actinomycetota bacterium]